MLVALTTLSSFASKWPGWRSDALSGITIGEFYDNERFIFISSVRRRSRQASRLFILFL